ncbi:AAA family ATPase [Mucilaginibacter corticis]|uniref:AAA family ATPase n=1 Tax=Mucilaginibacter corticis TaxID=2597670 RepID=A0A556MXH6_9SPHI|nr:AAA family ATPase [Mucilaginibacter corticis]TSJ44523.1 AAA family ATPase [Mucilaginibacter corticis]
MSSYKEHPTFQRPAEIELIRSMSHRKLTARENKRLDKYLQGPPSSKDAFIIKPAADWLETENDTHAGKLFGDFWYQGELCIMFADTNVGKSILAVQIGDSLSRGIPIPGIGGDRPAEKVLYFDFELSAAQFKKRYSSDLQGNYRFGPGFTRLVFNPDADGARKFATYADYLNNAIENVLITSGARILIIDNITCLRSSTEAAASAVALMSKLQAIKSQYGLSILVLAHTPKRNPARPISRNDLQGSKMLINFTDSAFAIGESQTDKGLRYLKQIKQRSGTQVHGADNVCLCRMIKPNNFLHFDICGREPEARHLLHYTEQQRKANEDRIIQLHDQGLSLRAIVAETNSSLGTVARLLRRLEKV